LRFLPALVVMAVIFYLSSQSRPPGQATARAVVGAAASHNDELAHAAMFAVLAVTLWWGFHAVTHSAQCRNPQLP